ncbi:MULTISPECIES: RagB/SusD family nutrient uptake outer membrane protein [Spirosoma]|uniref:RagB/SusD family nutrient uptake outer membrane protein n=1 Tax=Spirosoma liriopis TaxID=2937440 RepID=A0ABT0HKH7_9BACT|nr:MULTISPECIES: RagB/SusD family nutrient uptake outer membrane protein [Spirosoma]MCK8492677.1 RagB/SusD family nutrient uptake outer membrane protein [Spirosoma liriopis]UHG92142.1 RagB/SusD family nutrient uptake outer membrane protein [Spirosoma oryzicola]
MKKITLLVACLIGLSACQKDFLDLKPQSQPNVDNFYKTANDFGNAVNGAYDALQSANQYGGDYNTLSEARSDNVLDNDPSSGSGLRYNIDRFIEPTTNTVLRDTWGSLYTGINRCNLILDKIDAVSMDATLKARYKGEAQFIRALSYFNLVRLWGRVPLVLTAGTTTEARSYKRNEVTEIYTAIEKDLTDAAAGLPASYTGNDVGRATSGAAKGLLGKVYVTEKKYDLAVPVLRDLVNGTTYQLLPNIADVFSVTNKNNAELLFAVKFKKGGLLGEGHGSWYGTSIGDNIESSLRAAYAATDKRLPLTVQVPVPSSINVVPRKFYDELSATNDVGNDFPVLRFADVLLLYAEALNEVGYQADGEAFKALNRVRTRAGVATYTAAQLATKETFRTAVINERRLELALENDRWFDLIRTGTAVEAIKVTGITMPANRVVYPIPQSEIDVYNNKTTFPQNDGY